MKVEEPDLAGTYSYADYVSWQWTEMSELIHGKIFKMSPAPNTAHQRVSVELSRQVANYLKGKKCKVFSAPFDVRLPASEFQKSDKEIFTVVQPDLCVVCDPNKIDERGCLGAPDWIIEILSRHTSSKDLRQKFDVYEQSGVREYWVVHPVEQTVLVYVLDSDGKYASALKPYVKEDLLAPIALPELVIDLAQVFSEE
jgi:Uma2 family endonuclease